MMASKNDNKYAAIILDMLYNTVLYRMSRMGKLTDAIEQYRQLIAEGTDDESKATAQNLTEERSCHRTRTYDIRRAATYFACRLWDEEIEITPKMQQQIDFLKVGDEDETEKNPAS